MHLQCFNEIPRLLQSDKSCNLGIADPRLVQYKSIVVLYFCTLLSVFNKWLALVTVHSVCCQTVISLITPAGKFFEVNLLKICGIFSTDWLAADFVRPHCLSDHSQPQWPQGDHSCFQLGSLQQEYKILGKKKRQPLLCVCALQLLQPHQIAPT